MPFASRARAATVTRLAGTDRYETSAAVARFHTTVGFSLDRILLASGGRFPDALAGGPLGSPLGSPLVLTPAADLGDDAAALVGDNAGDLDGVYVLGGTDATGTSLIAIDVRAYTNVAYGLGDDGQLYSLNPANGTAVKLGATLVPAMGAIDDVAGIDFNPVVDRIRVLVGDENDGQTPEITAGAYTNGVRGGVATMTALFDLDSATDVLALQSPPNDGGLVTIGDLGIDLGAVNGFDLARNGAGYVLAADGVLPAQLYTVDLETGALTSAGQLPPALLLAGVTGLAVR